MRNTFLEHRGCVRSKSSTAVLAAMILSGCASASPSVSEPQPLFAAPKPFGPRAPEPQVAARLSSAKTALAERASNSPDSIVRGRAYLTRTLSIEQLKATLPQFAVDSVAYLQAWPDGLAVYYRQDRDNTVEQAMAEYVRAYQNANKAILSSAAAAKKRAKDNARPTLRAAENQLKSAKAMQADYEKNGLQTYAIEFCARPAELISLREAHSKYFRGIELVELSANNRAPDSNRCRDQ